MKERDYIVVGNLKTLTGSLAVLEGMNTFGMNKKEIALLNGGLKRLYTLQDKLFDKVTIDDSIVR